MDNVNNVFDFLIVHIKANERTILKASGQALLDHQPVCIGMYKPTKITITTNVNKLTRFQRLLLQFVNRFFSTTTKMY